MRSRGCEAKTSRDRRRRNHRRRVRPVFFYDAGRDKGGNHRARRCRGYFRRQWRACAIEPRIAAALAAARSGASFVLVFIHWGEENTNRVTERQRELARWLIDHGVDAIAGSHPHCLQPLDSYRGRPIIYSLGNLVFDGAPTLPNWNRGQLLAFDLGGPFAHRSSWSRCSSMRADSQNS